LDPDTHDLSFEFTFLAASIAHIFAAFAHRLTADIAFGSGAVALEARLASDRAFP
jgi:hypothetical protein